MIKDNKYYPDGRVVNISNERHMSSLISSGEDDSIYFYVDDNVDLNNIAIGDTLELDTNFEIIGVGGITSEK